MKRARDSATLDLFRNLTPSPAVERFEDERVRAAHLSARVKKAMSAAIKDSGHSRETIAALMSDQLGERVTAAMLDQYTSTANETNNVPAYRLIALYHATRDARLINALLDGTDLIAIDARFAALIDRELWKEQRDFADRQSLASDKQWKASR